jgi:hypothetical protein
MQHAPGRPVDLSVRAQTWEDALAFPDPLAGARRVLEFGLIFATVCIFWGAIIFLALSVGLR